jgi:hypothetical protein
LGKANIRLTKDFGDKRRKRNLNVKSTTSSDATLLNYKKKEKKKLLQFEKEN